MTRKNYIPMLAMLSLSTLAVVPVTAHAQSRLPRVSIHLRDRPVRAALERIFTDAGLQHAIDPQINGYVTLKIRNQPFENALKLIMRSSTTPLTYTRENNVYIVRPLRAAPVVSKTSDIPSGIEEFQGNVNPPIPQPYVGPMALQPWYSPYPFINSGPPIFLGGPIVVGGPGLGGPTAGGITILPGGGFGGLGSFGNFYGF